MLRGSLSTAVKGNTDVIFVINNNIGEIAVYLICLIWGSKATKNDGKNYSRTSQRNVVKAESCLD